MTNNDSRIKELTVALETAERKLTDREIQLATLQEELRERDQRIAVLEQLCADNRNRLSGTDHQAKGKDLVSESERLAAMGLALESLAQPGTIHRICKLTTTIGRGAGNDLAIDSDSVSRYHARIVVASDSTYLINLESTNGCKVNGERISRQILNDGDVITIGDVQFQFSVGAPSRDGDRLMDETVLLDDSVIFSPVPTQETGAPPERVAQDKAKLK